MTRSPHVSDGRLYGRGSADMKGGLAGRDQRSAHPGGGRRGAVVRPRVPVRGRRRAGRGPRHADLLDAGLLRGDACLVPEPTSLAVCVAERGLLQGEIVVKGRPAHGSRPRDGVSAIEQAAQIVLALHAADFGDPEHPLLGCPSANIGTFHGGSAVNIVAEEACVGFDRRLLPGVSLDEATTSVRERLQTAGLSGTGYSIEVRDFGEGSEMAPTIPSPNLSANAWPAATGAEPAIIGMPFTTDARFLRNQAGVPSVVCGPGESAQAHGIDEWTSAQPIGGGHRRLRGALPVVWHAGRPLGARPAQVSTRVYEGVLDARPATGAARLPAGELSWKFPR